MRISKKNTTFVRKFETKMKVSVIIPLYNKRAYVQRTLESVLAQTYTDYEVIVVDDGSTDDSGEVAERLIGGKADWHVLRQQNAGVAAARNAGVAASKGEYLAFLDADDWWAPTYLERMMDLIAHYPEAGLYACNYWYVKIGKTHVALNIPTGYFDYPKTYLEQKSMPVTSISVIMPRKVFDEMGGFPVGIKLGEDFLLWSKVALRYKVAFLSEPLAYYNNDIPANLRATRNLHKPEEVMWFVMGDLLNAPNILEDVKQDFKLVLDKERVSGLLQYYLNKRYHQRVIEELKKVDWSKQPTNIYKLYHNTPIIYLKAKQCIMKIGSIIKQSMIKQMRHEWALGFVENGLDGVFSKKPKYVWVKNPYADECWFADPFILDVTETTITLFVEEMRYSVPKGRIAKLTIDRETMTITDMKIILEEPTHLSFPNILRENGKIYVYPENHDSGELNLYEYDEGKEKLIKVKMLCKQPLTDAVMTDVFGKRQIYSTQMPDPNGRALNVYEQNERGEFVFANSISFTDKHARMAGQFFIYKDKIYRPAQDCNIVYGGAVVIEEACQTKDGLIFNDVKTLTSAHPILRKGMHTVNEYKGIVVIDVHGYGCFIGRMINWLVRLKKQVK